MSTVRIGVIGNGYWGPNLIRNFVALPDAQVVVVADRREDRLKHIRSLYPQIQVTQDYTDFFNMGLDAVVIATPPASHFALAKDCLEHGLHALVEKPLTLDSQSAQHLVDLAQEKGLSLMVGHTFVYNPAVRKVKELIESGELGEIYYIDTMRLNLGLFSPDLNVLWDLAPHDISILLYLLGQPPTSVRAFGNDCIFPGKPDVAYVNLTFPNHVVAHLHVSWLDPNKVRRITVVGSKKMLVYDDIESLEKIKIFDKGVDAPPYTDTYADFQCSYRYGDAVIPYLRLTEPLKVEAHEFICSIQEGRPALSSGSDGLSVVSILEAAQYSMDHDGTAKPLSVTINPEVTPAD